MFDSGPVRPSTRAPVDVHGSLVGLLVILMRPHVGRERAGKGVEGDPLEPIADERISRASR